MYNLLFLNKKKKTQDKLKVTNTYVSPTDPTDTMGSTKATDSTKPGDHQNGNLVQRGTDINFLISIGVIIMLIGAAYVFKEKLIRR